MGGAPQGQFLSQEGPVAAIHEVANHRMVGAVGLHQHFPGPVTPAGPARQLQEQLQALFAGPQVGPVQQAIGRQHRGQGDGRQVHALGQHLGAHQHIGLPGGKALQQAAVAIATAGGVPVKAQQAQAFELLFELLHHPLGASPEGLEGGRAAMGAALANLGAVVTPVAAQPLGPIAAAVDRERHIAIRTKHHLAAAAATEKTAVAAAGHQQHGLLAPLGQAAEALHQGPADQAAVAVLQLQSHVHQAHRWQGAAADALGQAQQLRGGCRPLAGLPGLQRWGGAAEHQAGTAAAGPVPGDVPGVIAGHGAVLLVGAVVLLIEHDQAQVGDRQKHRRAGAHHQQGLPTGHQAAAPGVDALALAATAMEFAHRRAKALAAAIEQLGHQADFGGQQQHPLPGCQIIRGRLEIHLGFAGTGDAPEQQALARGRAANLLQGGGLGTSEGLGRSQVQAGAPIGEISGLGNQRRFAHQAAPLQAVEHRPAEATAG